MLKQSQKVYGRDRRIRAILDTLTDQPEILPDMCIDMIYTIMVTY